MLWEKFINIMAQLLKEYQALVELNKEKRQVLINSDVDRLIGITKQEELIVLKINNLETQRQDVIKQIGAVLGQNGQTQAHEMLSSVSQLRKLSGEKYSAQIGTLSAQLTECVKQLRDINELNTKLISQQLEFIEFNINILSAASCDQTYSANPGDSQVKRRSLLNTQA